MIRGAEVVSFVRGVARSIYQALPKIPIWQWAEETLKMPRGGENVKKAGQRVSFDETPHVRDVADWFRSPGKQEMYIAKSSQGGFTMVILICILWHIVFRPRNIGYWIDTAEEAKKISKSRLKPWIRDNKILDRINEEEDDLSNLTYFLRSMVVYLMGSYGEGSYRNKALGIAVLDELDAHTGVDKQGKSVENARTRLKLDKNSKLIGFSTCKEETDQTWSNYQLGTRELWFVPCPHCGHFQPLVWKNVRYSGLEFEDLAGELILAKVAEDTYYECEFAKCRIHESEKYEMLKKGEWRATNPNAAPGIRSKHFSDLISNFATWGELALEWIAAQTDTDKLKTFTQSRLGEPFRADYGSLKERLVKDCREEAFHRGVCPIKPALVALIVDVQKETMKWIIGAYSDKGDFLPVEWGEETDWEDVAILANSSIKTAFGNYRVECGVVDEGDGNRAMEIREFTERFPHLFPVKGRGKGQIEHLIWPSKSMLLDVEVLTYHINDRNYKYELVYGRIKDGAKRRKAGKKRLILPIDVTPEFVAELMGEKLEESKNKYNQPVKEWVKTGTNDYLDCCKYGLAIWDLMVVDLIAAGRVGPETEVPAGVKREADPAA